MITRIVRLACSLFLAAAWAACGLSPSTPSEPPATSTVTAVPYSTAPLPSPAPTSTAPERRNVTSCLVRDDAGANVWVQWDGAGL